MSQSIPQGLALKLAAARKEARTVKKKGEGRDGNDTFRFARSEDVGKEARRLQRKHGFFVVPSAPVAELTFNQGGGVLAKVTMDFEVVDAETAECFTRQWVGSGFDHYGSGAASIATTTATKAFMSGLLGISFEPDPEERPALTTPSADEPKEPTHTLNVGHLLHRLRGLDRGDDLDSLNLFLGSCDIDAVEPPDEGLDQRGIELSERQMAAIYAELMRLEQDRDSLEVALGG